MPEIYVDGDACPVKGEVERVATRHGLPVHIVSNGGIRPSANPLVHNVAVGEGADAADDWIAERIGRNDIAVTADIPLAARCLEAGARGMALGMRELHRHIREASGSETRHAGFTKQDRSRFLDALENQVQAVKRVSAI